MPPNPVPKLEATPSARPPERLVDGLQVGVGTLLRAGSRPATANPFRVRVSATAACRAEPAVPEDVPLTEAWIVAIDQGVLGVAIRVRRPSITA
jgi:hypothetical protein